MSLDPYCITCPYCGEGRAIPFSLVPDEYDDDSAYVYTSWTCDKCDMTGWLTIRWSCVYAKIQNDMGETMRDEACE